MSASSFGHAYIANCKAAQQEVKRIANAIAAEEGHAYVAGLVDDTVGLIWQASQTLLPTHFQDVLEEIDKFLSSIIEGNVRVPLRIQVYQSLLDLPHLLDDDRVHYTLMLAELYLENKEQGSAMNAAYTALRLINAQADKNKGSSRARVAKVLHDAQKL